MAIKASKECQKCGAPAVGQTGGFTKYECGSEFYEYTRKHKDGIFHEAVSGPCLRNQLEQALEREAALQAQVARVKKLWDNCPDNGTYEDGEDYIDAMNSLLSTSPRVLAVVDGWWDDCFVSPFVPGDKIPHEDEMWKPVTVIVLAKGRE